MKNIQLNTLYDISKGRTTVSITKEELNRVQMGRKIVEKMIADGKIMYGVNTGFGELAKVKINKNQLKQLQKNIILSHSVGNGRIIEKEYSRGALFLKLNTFLKGNSGVSIELVNTMRKMLEKDLIPATYEGGSLGASGDLIPFAHMFATLFGKGKFYYKNKLISAKEGLKILKIKKFELKEKEGLALTNGMQFTATIGGINLYKLKKLLMLYLDLASIWFEIENINKLSFRKEIYQLRQYQGVNYTLNYLKKNLTGINIEKDKVRVQDPYTIRCVPQVIGGIIDNLLYVQSIHEVEFNSVSDNPLFIPEKELYLSTGNFHGESLSIALDSAAISSSVLLLLIERQVNRLINPHISLYSPFLTENPGINSGFMLVQYSLASLANRNSTLSTPSSSYSIPVSGDQEDFVSMAGNSALKFKQSVENLEEAISLFALTIFQVNYISKKQLKGKKNKTLIEKLSEVLKPIKKDLYIKDEMEKAKLIIQYYYNLKNDIF